MGEPITARLDTTADISGVDQLVPVTINPVSLVANPTTTGTLVANLESNSAVVTPGAGPPAVALPSANTTNSTYTNQTSITAYDNLGNAVNLNVYFTNTGNNTWEVDVYKAADATNGGFPYQKTTAGVTTTDTPLVTQTLTFSPTTGDLTSPTALTINIPNGQTLNLNIAQMTQLASSFSISNSTVNGNSPATFQNVSIATDGTLSEVYSNGTTVPVYRFRSPRSRASTVSRLSPAMPTRPMPNPAVSSWAQPIRAVSEA